MSLYLICILWLCSHHLLRSDDAHNLNSLVDGLCHGFAPVNKIMTFQCGEHWVYSVNKCICVVISQCTWILLLHALRIWWNLTPKILCSKLFYFRIAGTLQAQLVDHDINAIYDLVVKDHDLDDDICWSVIWQKCFDAYITIQQPCWIW